MIIGLLVLGVFIWRKGTPDYYWSKAQAAMEAEQYEAARIHLTNLVRRHPTHADGLELLSRVVLLEARSKNRPPTFQANPASVEFLAKAAELRPGDANLQRRALRAQIAVRQMGKAADIAEQLYKTDSKSGDAHFALMWRAVEKKDATRVAKLTEDFAKLQSSHVFQVYALIAKFHWDNDEKSKSDEILRDAAKLAERLTPEQLELLERRDRETMLAMLLAYEDRAKQPSEALVRARKVIDACKKMQAGNNLVDKRVIANAAAQSIALFNMKYPPISVDRALSAVHAGLAKEAEKLGTVALADKASGPAPMLVYWNTARSHMTSGELDKALAVLNDGFAAAKQMGSAIGDQHLDLHLLAARILIMKREFTAANKHLDQLIGHKKFEGWAHLLKGSVALHEGRLQSAESSFAAARQGLGDTVLVKMSMAHTAMALEQWDKAVPMLEALLLEEETLSDEQKAWFVQLLGSGTRVHYDLLRAKLAQRRWADAQQHLRILRETEFEPGAWNLAVTYKWDDEKDEAYARKLLDLARQKYPDDLGLALLDARLLKEKGQHAESTELLENFAKADTTDNRRQLALVRWLMRNREPNKALEILEGLESNTQLDEKSRDALAVYRAQALLSARQIDRAKEEVDLLTQKDSTKTAGYLMKAALAFREKDQESGLSYLEEAKKANPRNPALNMLMSSIYRAQGDFEGVLDSGADIMDVNRFSTEIKASVNDALQKLAEEKGINAALEKVDELLKTRPNEISLRVLKVDFLVRSGRHDDAMRELDAAERQAPHDLNIPRLKAQVLVAQGRPDKALEEAIRAVKIDSQNPDAIMLASQVAIIADKPKEAIAFAETARRMVPTNPRGYLLLADALQHDGRVDDAIGVLRGYSQRFPKDTAIRATIVELLRSTPGREADAINEVREARKLKPGDYRLLATEVSMLIDMGRPEEAQSVAREALGPEPRVSDMLLVGQAFADGDEVVNAEYWGKRAMEAAKAGERTQCNLYLGRLYLREGRADPELGRGIDRQMLEKARERFAEVLETEPRHLVAGNNLAWLLAEHFDRPDESLRIIEAVRGGAPVGNLPAAFIDTMAHCYEAAGDAEKATEVLSAGLTTYPQDPQLLFRQGMLLISAEPSQAKIVLQRAVEVGGLSEEDEVVAREELERL
jgi:predicted Zn-dependent protease